MPRHLESQEQRLFVHRVRLDPRTRDLPTFAVPNGGRRGKVEAAIFKAEGVSAGVPDWMCCVPRGGGSHSPHNGLALEFKSPTGKGRLTEAQRAWHDKLREHGWRVEVVTTSSEAWAVLCDHLGIAA